MKDLEHPDYAVWPQNKSQFLVAAVVLSYTQPRIRATLLLFFQLSLSYSYYASFVPLA
jgi:hypothetical protein